MKYGKATGRIERCQRCYLEFDVDELGRVPQHRRRTGSGWDGHGAHSLIGAEMCPKAGHPSREELARRKERRAQERTQTIEQIRDEVAVVLDAIIEGRAIEGFTDKLKELRKLAMHDYRSKIDEHARMTWRWITTVGKRSQNSHTLGDVYCTFCGEMLAMRVTRATMNTARPASVEQHMTICMLQHLAGMREPVPKEHRALPMEFIADEVSSP